MESTAAREIEAFQRDRDVAHLDAAIAKLEGATEGGGRPAGEALDLLSQARWMRFCVRGAVEDIAGAVTALKECIVTTGGAPAQVLVRFAQCQLAQYETSGDGTALETATETFERVIRGGRANAFEPQIPGLAKAWLLRYRRSGAARDLEEAVGLTLPARYTNTDPGAVAIGVQGVALHELYRRFGSIGRLEEAIAGLAMLNQKDSPVVLERVAAYAEALIDRELLYPGREGWDAVEEVVGRALRSCAATAPGAAECRMALGHARYLIAFEATRPEQTYEGAPVIRRTGRMAESAVELLRSAADGMQKGAPRRALCLARLADAMVLVARSTRSAEERERAVETAWEAAALLGARAPDGAAVHRALANALRWRGWEGDAEAAAEHLELAATQAGDAVTSLVAGLEWMAAGGVRAAVHVERILHGLYDRLAGEGRLSIDLLEEGTKWVGDGGVIGGHAEKTVWHRPSWMTKSFGWGRRAAHAWAEAGCWRQAIEALERERLTVLDCGMAGDLRPPRWSELKEASRACPMVYVVPGEGEGHALVLEGGREYGFRLPGLTTGAIDKLLFGELRTDPQMEGAAHHEGTIVGPENAAGAGLTAAYAFWQMEGTDPRHQETWLKPLDECGKWLGENLQAELEKNLASERLVVIATGALALMPVQAAWLPDAGRTVGRRYLIDTYEMRLAASARVVMRSRREGRAESLFAVGDPEPADGRALPFANLEARIAGGTFAKKQVLEGAEATPVAVVEGIQRAEVVHLACHAYANYRRAQDSSIGLAGGERLPLWDVVRMDLSRARLVTLSACESGKITRAAADQAVSFASGLLGAGARGAIATGWEIDDLAAGMLMLRFYHAWRVEGAEPAAALRVAQIWLRDTTNRQKAEFCKTLLPEFGGSGVFDGDAVGEIHRTLALRSPEERSYTHPYFWAAFAYSGQ